MSYQLLRIEKIQYQFLFVSMSSQNPFEYMDEIETSLRAFSAKGVILFDMLTYLGNNSNRFIEARFDGVHFISETFKVVEIPKNSEIRSMTQEVLSYNRNCLISTVLSEAQRSMLLSGLAI